MTPASQDVTAVCMQHPLQSLVKYYHIRALAIYYITFELVPNANN